MWQRLKNIEADAEEENLNYEGQLYLEGWWGRDLEKITQRKGLLCAESWKTKINPNSTTVSSQVDSTTAKRNSRSILSNQYIPGLCFFIKPPSLDQLLKYLAKDLETDPLPTENRAFEMTVDISDTGLTQLIQALGSL